MWQIQWAHPTLLLSELKSLFRIPWTLPPGGAEDHVNYEMNQNLSMPSGLAVITILTIPEGPPPDDDGEPSLEERITELEQTNAELKASKTLLEETAADLQGRVASLTDSVGLWQLLSGVALILGAVVGYFVMRFHGQ